MIKQITTIFKETLLIQQKYKLQAPKGRLLRTHVGLKKHWR